MAQHGTVVLYFVTNISCSTLLLQTDVAFWKKQV